ncbi:GyrI-like domain-containing protein [Planctomycetota bacterium]|jgi:effector-binding domain-containing protein|nr:GyrI-like domain-containing protein [Planctomycetota bacterium]
MARSLSSYGLPAGLGLLLLSLSACSPAGTQSSVSTRPLVAGWTPPVEVSHPPFRAETFHANWLNTRGAAYVYMEVLGDYRNTGSAIRVLLSEANQQGLRIVPNSSPFCLFYDDPGGGKPASDLRARVGIEIEQIQAVQAPLGVDSLPAQTVVHACVSGPYPGASRAYPLLFQYMGSKGWAMNGPIQEIYHVFPGPDTPASELVCEILVPVRTAGR